MKDVVIRCKANGISSCLSRLKNLGIDIRDEFDKDNNKRRIEEQAERCRTPYLYTADGDAVFTIRMTDEQAEKIPKNDTPNFTTDWRSDWTQEDAEGNLTPVPWPIYPVEGVDEEGNPYTYEQGAGRII